MGQFFLTNAFLVGLSIDGPAEFNDSFELICLDWTYKRILTVLRLLQSAMLSKCPYGIDGKLARHPQSVWNGFKESIDYVQFIPCLPGLDESKNVWALTPETFAQFYKGSLTYGKIICLQNIQVYGFWKYASVGRRFIPSHAECSEVFSSDYRWVEWWYISVRFYALDVARIGNINEISLEEYAKSRF